MSTQSRLRKLLQRFHAFQSDRSGNVAIIFALASLPLVGFVGAAVDYSIANSARTALQASLDATALLLSKEAPNLSQAQLTQKATDYFMANFNRPEVTGVSVSPTFSSPLPGSFVLVLDGVGTVPTKFANVLGKPTIGIHSTTQVNWGIKKLEVALALDNTGSMSSSGKMTNLKSAAHSLLTTLQGAAKKDGDVKVSIIPFDTTVRMGTAYKDQPWFDVSCSALGSPSGCTNSNWKNYWEGCVADRTYPYDAQDTPPNNGTAATLYPIYDCGSLVTAMPLTFNWASLHSKIDSMTPNGNTNVTIGLVWAWHSLTANTPYTEGAAPTPDLDKVIILLTDGDNTQSWKNSNNTTVTSQAAIDARTALACTNVKAANIKIYAIRVINGNANLLQSCATNPTMYYDVQQASQLNNVFSAIAQNLANLRVAK